MIELMLEGGVSATPVADKTLLLLRAKDGVTNLANPTQALTKVGAFGVVATQSKFDNDGAFNCVSGRVDVGTASDYNFPAGQDFTIEFWAFNTSTASNLWWISKGTGTTSCVKTYQSTLYLQTQTSAASAATTGVYSTARWQHWALVRKGTVTTLYIDGVAKLTLNDSSAFGSASQLLRIGGYEGYCYGYLDQIRVSKVARYDGPFTPPTTRFTID